MNVGNVLERALLINLRDGLIRLGMQSPTSKWCEEVNLRIESLK